ncbi:MAG: GDP-mannose 4,6-dehydratase [Acidimicrobiales bacterium]|nr:GDP-mannose 4,6-dehydratase [Acidimicrobiales bacterium]
MTDTPAWSPDRTFWRNRPVAVTGATGFLGSHLTAQLVDLGANIVVLVRDDVPGSPIADTWTDQVAVVRGAVEDTALVERMLGDYEVRTVLHLAAQSQVGVANRHPLSTYEANVAGTWSVLEAARRSPRVSEVVTASSDKAYGAQPQLPYDEDMPLLAVNPYDVSKACADLISTSYHRTFGVPVCVTRCGNFFGPGDRNWERLVPGTIRSLLRGERPVIRSDGTMVRDYLYVVDGALAYLRLVEAMASDPAVIGQAFNFSTETPLTVLELLDALQETAGTDLEPDIRATATHEIDSQFLSAAKARKVLGWVPTVSVETALVQTVEWYRQQLDGVDT